MLKCYKRVKACVCLRARVFVWEGSAVLSKQSIKSYKTTIQLNSMDTPIQVFTAPPPSPNPPRDHWMSQISSNLKISRAYAKDMDMEMNWKDILAPEQTAF